MDDTNSLIEQRKAKLAALRAKGIDPFQNKFPPGETCDAARKNYVEGREVAVAGRITAHRDMGKSMFIDIRDQSGRIQAYAQKNVLGDEQFHIFQHLDLGDFIGVKGTLFTTKTGEISVKLTSFVILTKALRPPPAKYYGLEDTEIRYRQRYLDLIANPDVKDVMLKRSAIIHEIRNFFHERNYVEVETPAMQAIPGGAAAQPFKTFHNALGCNFYLRIAMELYHKRLLVGGIDKLFEIGKNFRNEGLSRRHNPEFTMLEAYCAFGDYAMMMETVESLIKHVSQKVMGTQKVSRNRHRELFRALASLIIYGQGYLEQLQEACSQPERVKIDLTKTISAKFFELRERFVIGHHNAFHWEIAGLAWSELQPLFKQVMEYRHNNAGLFERPSPESDLTEKERENSLRKFAVLDSTEDQIKLHADQVIELTAEEWIDLAPNWRRAEYKDLVRETVREKTSGIIPDWFALSPQDRRRAAIELLKLGGDIGANYEDFEVTGAVFEKLIEPTLIQPTFVTHLPKELVPLARLSPDDPTTVEVFECCINGQEISPGYTEQNDPIAQRTTLEHQVGGEQQELDEDFLVALEHGMPPAGGIGIGIDRLCMMLLGQESIRDVILFPQLKPK
jgi:lysyl-tRNA synthetase class 2